MPHLHQTTVSETSLGGASRPLIERKHSVTLRVAELRKALAAAERAEAEIDILIEQAERARERARAGHAAE